MLNSIHIFVLTLLVLQCITSLYSFRLNVKDIATNTKFKHQFKTKLQMISSTSIDFSNAFGILPICITATSKTTTINDPTAGMSPEEITNYISNVGGGMCGYPEPVRAAIGLGLNLSLIVFGIFTVSYVILGGLNFALDKNVEDIITKQISEYEDNDDIIAFAESAGVPLKINRKSSSRNVNDFDINNNDNSKSKNTGLSREERRIKSKINKMK